MAFYEAGRYQCRIIQQALAENKHGNPEVQLVIQPYIQQGANDEAIPVTDGNSRTIFLTLTEATIGTADKPGWVLDTLRFLGWQGLSFASLDPAEEGHHSFVGLELVCRCRLESYAGKEREKWEIVRGNPTALTPGEKLQKKALKSLDAKFGKVLKATIGKAPAATPPSNPANQVLAGEPNGKPRPGIDEDIPF